MFLLKDGIPIVRHCKRREWLRRLRPFLPGRRQRDDGRHVRGYAGIVGRVHERRLAAAGREDVRCGSSSGVR